MRDDDNRRNNYYEIKKSGTWFCDTQRLEVANCAKLKPSIFRSSRLGILALTQLREIPSPCLANAQVDSFKDDNSVDSTELGPVPSLESRIIDNPEVGNSGADSSATCQPCP